MARRKAARTPPENTDAVLKRLAKRSWRMLRIGLFVAPLFGISAAGILYATARPTVDTLWHAAVAKSVAAEFWRKTDFHPYLAQKGATGADDEAYLKDFRPATAPASKGNADRGYTDADRAALDALQRREDPAAR